MAAFTTVLAFDLGASTGRAIRAVYDGERLQWKEIHRFDNIPAVENGHLRWNMEAAWGDPYCHTKGGKDRQSCF